MKKILWFLIILFLLIVLIIIGYFTLFNRSSGECYKLRESSQEGVWFRLLHKGMSCKPKPRSLLNSQFCYSEDRLEYKYCQEVGEFENYDGLKILCSQGNYFLLFNHKCEDISVCEPANACEYNLKDNICCYWAFFKDYPYRANLMKYDLVESSMLSPNELYMNEETYEWVTSK